MTSEGYLFVSYKSRGDWIISGRCLGCTSGWVPR